MAWDTFARVVDHTPASVETLTFSLAGEPMLHDGLGQMIEYAHQADVRVVLATNGTLLTGERLEELARSPLAVVNVSVETDAKTAREVRGIDLEVIRQNIRDFVARKRPTTDVKLALVAHAKNQAGVVHKEPPTCSDQTARPRRSTAALRSPLTAPALSRSTASTTTTPGASIFIICCGLLSTANRARSWPKCTKSASANLRATSVILFPETDLLHRPFPSCL